LYGLGARVCRRKHSLKIRPDLGVTPESRGLLAHGSCLRLLPQGGLPLGLGAMDPFGAGKPSDGVPGPPVSDRLDGGPGDTVGFPDLPGTQGCEPEQVPDLGGVRFGQDREGALPHVPRVVQDLQVLQAVVPGVSVDVVHLLVEPEGAGDHGHHLEAVEIRESFMVTVLQVDTVVAVIAEMDLQVVGLPLVADDLIVRADPVADPVVHEAGDLVEGLAVKNPGDGLVHGGISIMNNQHRGAAKDGFLGHPRATGGITSPSTRGPGGAGGAGGSADPSEV